jgi:DNA-binding IclR family transcriptional regulator
MAAIYYAADGSRSPAQIAEATSLPIATVQTSLDALIQIGALVTSS